MIKNNKFRFYYKIFTKISYISKTKQEVIMITTKEDLVLDYLYDNKSKAKNDEPPFDMEEEVDEDDSMSWLNNLD